MARSLVAPCTSLTLLLASCGQGDTVSRTVGEKHFEVPRRFAITTQLDWLPKSQTSDFLFILNPEDQTINQVIVHVQSKSEFCNRSGPREREVTELCGGDDRIEPEAGLAGLELQRSADHSGTWWVYQTTHDKTGHVVADCFKSNAPKNAGNCSSLGRIGDLFYTLGYGERQIGRLAEFHRQTRDKLRSWEVL